MVRTQVQFTRDQLAALRERAARENVSVSEIVRRAVDALVRRDRTTPQAELIARASAIAGRYGSGTADVSADHDRHLVDAFQK